MVHEERVCDFCGGAYQSRTKSPKLEKFCSKQCYVRASNRKYRDKKNAYRVEDRTRTCEHCGKVFQAGRTRPHQKNCSKECSVANHYARMRAMHNRSFVPMPCPECGKEFTPDRSTQKHCSAICRNFATNRERKANYVQKRRRTFREIPLSVRRFVLARDEYLCVLCKRGGKLNLHHWDASGETDKPNNDAGNLKTVCSSCHKQLHTINYRIIEGVVYVYGKMFDLLNVDTVKVLRQQ